MREHTKKRLTKISVKGMLANKILMGPEENVEEAIKVLTALGFEDVSDSIPWREAFPEYSNEQLPGVCLAGARRKKELTQKELAGMIGVPQSNISEMETGKRTIGKKMAKRLAKITNVGYRLFL
ncbi:MAG: helix-turn-helix transcriptional regulator [Thermodesulfobacteriota bacterium]|nr:helix-turn-helix transcriptional regulator [Thermodesulfobacteriota bacterium]